MAIFENRINKLAQKKTPQQINSLIKRWKLVFWLGIANIVIGYGLAYLQPTDRINLWGGGFLAALSLGSTRILRDAAERQNGSRLPPKVVRKYFFARLGILLIVLIGVAVSFFVGAIILPVACADVAHPNNSILACRKAIKVFSAVKNKNKATYETLLYLHIWQHLAYLHSGQDDGKEFAAYATPHLSNEWPSPVFSLFLGTATPDEVYQGAKKGKPADLQNQLCEAEVYVGEWGLLKGQKQPALQVFQAALSTCTQDQIERTIATSEIKDL
jgi:hypothetical protein